MTPYVPLLSLSDIFQVAGLAFVIAFYLGYRLRPMIERLRRDLSARRALRGHLRRRETLADTFRNKS